MRKSLRLQAEMIEEFGACVFDVTLDCEDGAPVGGERAHAEMVVALIGEAAGSAQGRAPKRIAVRVHAVDHPAFDQDIATVVGGVGNRLCHLMVPKVESVSDVERAVAAVDQASHMVSAQSLPLHVLLESPAAVHRAFDIAAHRRVQSISFGLMDFVSAHGGAIPARGMSGAGQFSHLLVVRAKLEIAAACHAHGKTPSHSVVTEFRDKAAVANAARFAAQDMGFTRMWSIHPAQIRPILSAFAPTHADIETAAEIIAQAQQAQWAPIEVGGQLHDRASYRFYWQLLERAYSTGQAMPQTVRDCFAPALQ